MAKNWFAHSVLAFGFLGLVLASCSTDVELDAPYVNTAVVYGILDYTVDTQFVRINKTYSGPGDLYDYAQIKDSVEYQPGEVDAWLIKLQNGNPIDSLELQYITKPSRSEGAFYSQDVGYYYTAEPLFTETEIGYITGTGSGNPEMEYQIRVTAAGKTFRATTDFPVVRYNSILNPSFSGDDKLIFYRSSSNSYENINLRFSRAAGTYRYEGTIRVNFEYVQSDGSVVTGQHFDYKVGNQTNSNSQSGTTTMNFPVENWYTNVGPRFQALPDVQKVRIVDFEFILTGANQILNTFLSFSRPVSEFSPPLTGYTNLDNGGLGVLASRTTVSNRFEVEDAGIAQLMINPATALPCYCVIQWPLSTHVCTDGLEMCP